MSILSIFKRKNKFSFYERYFRYGHWYLQEVDWVPIYNRHDLVENCIDHIKPICMFVYQTYLYIKHWKMHLIANTAKHFWNKVISTKEVNVIFQIINLHSLWHINLSKWVKRDITKIFIDETHSKPPRKNYPINK